MPNPFEKMHAGIRHAKPVDEGSEQKRAEENAIETERLGALVQFFKHQPPLWHLDRSGKKTFTPEDYVQSQSAFELDEVSDFANLTEEEARQVGRSQADRYIGDLHWLQEQGYIKLINLDLYALTDNGENLLAPRH